VGVVGGSRDGRDGGSRSFPSGSHRASRARTSAPISASTDPAATMPGLMESLHGLSCLSDWVVGGTKGGGDPNVELLRAFLLCASWLTLAATAACRRYSSFSPNVLNGDLACRVSLPCQLVGEPPVRRRRRRFSCACAVCTAVSRRWTGEVQRSRRAGGGTARRHGAVVPRCGRTRALYDRTDTGERRTCDEATPPGPPLVMGCPSADAGACSRPTPLAALVRSDTSASEAQTSKSVLSPDSRTSCGIHDSNPTRLSSFFARSHPSPTGRGSLGS